MSTLIASESRHRFQRLVYAAGEAGQRVAMPWRETEDPYHIFVSEMMLQQTQVGRVLPKYSAFVAELADFTTLARASLADVLRLWQGLGYNRRAKFMHSAAQQIVEQHAGRLPDDRAMLVALPGIGSNTAGALLAFAYNRPVVFIETNIRRVFIHYWFSQQPDLFGPHPTRPQEGKAEVSDSDIIPLIEATLDRRDPRRWYYNLMDWGAQLGRGRHNPNRRSRHYSRQSSFVGSNREARGRLLRLLTERATGASVAELPQLTALPYGRISVALEQLQQEGFVVCDRGRARLAER